MDHYGQSASFADDLELDDFDRNLIAESSGDHLWQASHGNGRISVPPKSNLSTNPNGLKSFQGKVNFF